MGASRKVVVLALCAGLGVPSCSGDGGIETPGKMIVVASIFPLYDLVRRVGGESADVRLLLPPGRSEHDFDPTVAEVKSISNAKVAFLVGLEMDEWLVKTVEASGGGATVVRLGEKVTTRAFSAPLLGATEETRGSAVPGAASGTAAGSEKPAAGPAKKDDHHDGHHDDHDDHDARTGGATAAAPASAGAADGDHHEEAHGHGHDHGSAPDPHVWLSVLNSIKMVDAIAAALSTTAPVWKDVFTANASKLKNELTALQNDVKARTGAFTKKGFITFHGSFGYFADAYGLEIVAIIEPSPGKEPSPAYLKSVLEFIKGKPIGALYIEPQLDPRPGEVLAHEAGLPLLTLDPIGGRPETDTYEKLIRFNLDALEKSLK